MIKFGTHEIKGIRVGSVAIGKVMRGDKEIWSAEEPVPDAMVVEGAGTTAANGIYLRDGEENDNPKYNKNGYIITGQTELGETQWSIRFESSSLYSSDDTAPSPDLVQTWVEDDGEEPAPTVRRAIASDFD